MSEIESTASSGTSTGLSPLEEQQAAEHKLWMTVFKASAVAIPICMALWVGIVYFAVSDTSAALVPPLAIGAVIGAFAGAFFGGWAGFLMASHTLDEVDRQAARH